MELKIQREFPEHKLPLHKNKIWMLKIKKKVMPYIYHHILCSYEIFHEKIVSCRAPNQQNNRRHGRQGRVAGGRRTRQGHRRLSRGMSSCPQSSSTRAVLRLGRRRVPPRTLPLPTSLDLPPFCSSQRILNS
jgi:hypothetical protein